MKIILRKDYDQLGKAGETVNVKPGYARNFLIPKGFALLATAENEMRFAKEIKQLNWKKELDKKRAEKLVKELENISCTITVQVGEEDKLFGSVTTQNIAESLESAGYTIDKRKILLEEPIKSLGIYSVPIKLYADIVAKVKVWVVKE